MGKPRLLEVAAEASPKRFLAVLALLAVGLLGSREAAYAVPAPGGSLVTDGFEGPTIDPSTWSALEFVRQVSGGKLESKIRGVGSGGQNINSLFVINPDSISKLQAEVTLLAASVTGAGGASPARARLFGAFYNDGTPGSGAIGDVKADIGLGHDGSVVLSVSLCNDPPCDAISVLFLDNTTFVGLALGTTHTLYLEFDGVQFIFKVDGMPVNYAVPASGPGAHVTVANDPFKAIGTRASVPGGSAFVSATFDNVEVDATPYDDFEAGSLDPAKWLNQEAIRRVSGGALESSITRFGTSAGNDLTLLQPGAVTALQADVTVIAVSNVGAFPNARLFGAFYNDGTPGSGFVGEVIAEMQIAHDGTGLRGSFSVVRCTAPDCNLPAEVQILLADTTTFPAVQPGTVHRLSLSWNGSRFLFGFDEATASFDPTTAAPVAGPSKVAYKGIGTRLSGISSPAQSAAISARFDNFVGLNAPGPGTSTASVGIGGMPANGDSANPAVSADGRLVAFGSVATNLVTGGCTSGVRQIYVRDPIAGTTECVSVDPGGAPGNGQSSKPALSADGRFVAFVSEATNLASGCAGTGAQILVRDRQSGTTTCESVGPVGAGNGASDSPVLSADGRFVAFASTASNLASPCTAGGSQVFVRDRVGGATACLSAVGAAAGNGASAGPSLNGDGRFVAFHSTATNLAAGCGSGVQQVLVLDRLGGAISCESVGPGGVAGTGASRSPVLSASGMRVAFLSAAPNLASPCTTGTVEAFVRDRGTGITRCASVGPGGVLANAAVETVALSGNGRVLVFTAGATNLRKPRVALQDTSGAQVFGEDLGASGSAEGLDSSLPSVISQSSDGELGSSSSTNPALSFDGGVTVFQSPAPNLVPGDTNATDDIFQSGPARRPTIVSPFTGTALALQVPTSVTFAWTASAGAVKYGLEFTGPNRLFTNPNGTGPDPVNGFGGAGGAVLVSGTSLAAVLGPEVPPGSYQLRVIGLSASGQPVSGFSDALTLLLGPITRPVIIGPSSSTSVLRGTTLSVVWTGVPGAGPYGLEFTGTNRQFANPNDTAPDPVNGFGGAGGGALVPGTTFTAALPADAPPGSYQLRVIGLSATGLVGTFSDALTLIIE